MLENILMLSSAVVAMVEFVKSVLVKSSLFASLDEQTQSIVLQVLAFIFGVIAALSWQLNAFPQAPGQVGVIFTGLIAATGSAGIHVILAWLGVRVEVTAEVEHRVDTRPQAADRATGRTYAPWN